MAVICFRFFDFKSFEDIDRLTIREFGLMNKALDYKLVDRQNEIHMLAFLTNAAGAVKTSGSRQVPVYRTYKEFFDYQKELGKLEDKPMKSDKYKKLAELVHKYEKSEVKNNE